MKFQLLYPELYGNSKGINRRVLFNLLVVSIQINKLLNNLRENFRICVKDL